MNVSLVLTFASVTVVPLPPSLTSTPAWSSSAIDRVCRRGSAIAAPGALPSSKITCSPLNSATLSLIVVTL